MKLSFKDLLLAQLVAIGIAETVLSTKEYNNVACNLYYETTEFLVEDGDNWDTEPSYPVVVPLKCQPTPQRRRGRSRHLVALEIGTEFPLSKCQGDCDSDDDCAGDLLCFQRSGYYTDPIPGCTGTLEGNNDYCFDPADIVPGQLTVVGNDGIPDPLYPLDACLADCDSDDDCKGAYRCYQRDATHNGPIPGCTGELSVDNDYCYDPTVPVMVGHLSWGFECGCLHGDNDLCAEEDQTSHKVYMKACDPNSKKQTWLPLPSTGDAFLLENLESTLCMKVDSVNDEVITNQCDLDEPAQQLLEPDPHSLYEFPV